MITTALFIELVIIGMQSAVWLLLLSFSVFGYEWFPIFASDLRDWTALVTMICVSLFYTLGIVMDRIWAGLALILSPYNFVLEIPYVKNKSIFLDHYNKPSTHAIDGTLSTYMIYTVTRLRIAKSTFFRSILISLAGILFVILQIDDVDVIRTIQICLIIGFVGFLVSGSSLLAYAILEKTYRTRLRQIEEIG